MKIYIRNMACESCKVVVKDALDELRLHPVKVELGMAEIKEEITEAKKEKFENIINEVGLEIVESKGGILVEKIKLHCQKYIVSNDQVKVNLSEYLSQKLKKDYNYLSNLFSELEANTITNYVSSIKIERAKEMILFEDHNLTEIAEKLNFSTLSAFSTQFKKISGFTPTHFKKLKEKRRLAMQQLSTKNSKI